MSDYTKTTNFTAKDSLSSGDPAKKIKGSEFDTEFGAIETSSATKANKVTAGTTNNLVSLAATGDLQDSGYAASDFASIVASATSGNLVTLTTAGNIQDSGVAIGTAALNVLKLDSGGLVPVANIPDIPNGNLSEIYPFFYDGSGAFTNQLPSGWSASMDGSGTVTITHLLGTSAYALPMASHIATANTTIRVNTYENSNYFKVYMYSAGTGNQYSTPIFSGALILI